MDVLPYGEGGARIVVIADTHSVPHPAMAERLAELDPDYVLHAGDIGDRAVLDDLAAWAPRAKLFAVRGNIDLEGEERRVLELTGPAGMLRMLLVHIAVYGPKLRPEVAAAAREVGASLVVCGHSHVPFIGSDKGVSVFNPGSAGPRRFTLPILFGVIELREGVLRLEHRECATGERWRP